jgi:hypothetical protein
MAFNGDASAREAPGASVDRRPPLIHWPAGSPRATESLRRRRNSSRWLSDCALGAVWLRSYAWSSGDGNPTRAGGFNRGVHVATGPGMDPARRGARVSLHGHPALRRVHFVGGWEDPVETRGNGGWGIRRWGILIDFFR